MTAPITEFIRARVDEDEAAAHAAGGDRWAYDAATPSAAANGEVYRPDRTRETRYGDGHVSLDYSYVTMDSEGLTPAVDEPEGVHIARQNPARTLADVAFKRNILSTHEPYSSYRTDRFDCSACSCMASSCWQSEPVPFPCDELRRLAAIWPEHSDYQQDWAP